jgi:hypothetical protein
VLADHDSGRQQGIEQYHAGPAGQIVVTRPGFGQRRCFPAG